MTVLEAFKRNTEKIRAWAEEKFLKKTDMDSELSPTSENPVKNKTVHGAINDLNTFIGTVDNKLYAQTEEPDDAPEGALWLDIDEELMALFGTQPDWNQNDTNSLAYVHNRPCYTEVITNNYIALHASDVSPILGVGIYPKSIGLELGTQYAVDINTTTGVNTLTLTAVTLAGNQAGMPSATGLTNNTTFMLYDNMTINVNGQFVEGDGAVYIITDPIQKVFVHGFKSTTVVYHTMPNEYINIDNEMLDNSNNLVSNKTTKAYIDSQIAALQGDVNGLSSLVGGA